MRAKRSLIFSLLAFCAAVALLFVRPTNIDQQSQWQATAQKAEKSPGTPSDSAAGEPVRVGSVSPPHTNRDTSGDRAPIVRPSIPASIDPVNWGVTLETLPDQARLAAARKLAQSARAKIADERHEAPRAAMLDDVRKMLRARETDPAWNPGAASLTSDELDFAAKAVDDMRVRQEQMQKDLQSTGDSAFDEAVDKGQFVRLPRPDRPKVTSLGDSQARLDAMKESRAALQGIYDDLSRQLGTVGKDWWHSSTGAGTASYVVYITRAQAPIYFKLAEEVSTYSARRDDWLRQFFSSRRREIPDGLLPRR